MGKAKPNTKGDLHTFYSRWNICLWRNREKVRQQKMGMKKDEETFFETVGLVPKGSKAKPREPTAGLTGRGKKKGRFFKHLLEKTSRKNNSEGMV